MLVNMRGFKSKQTSLTKMMKKVSPSMVLMNETLLVGRAKVSISPYTCWSRNRKETGGGGIATAVAPQFKDDTVGAGEGEGDDEYLITRIECFSPALNVINCYGEQRKNSKEDVEGKWMRLRKEMETIRARGEFCLCSGDLNKLVGSGPGGIPGNHPEISLGGRLLRSLLITGDWILVNALGQAVVEGGPFTRRDPATGKESCLDLFIVSRELLPYVSKLTIDSGRKMAVYRAVKRGRSYRRVYSDHYTCLLTLKDLPRRRQGKSDKKVVWNLAREGGWEKYHELTEEYSEPLKIL